MSGYGDNSADSIYAFKIGIPESDLIDLRRRLAGVRWPSAELGEGWDDGVPLRYLQELVGYWCD